MEIELVREDFDGALALLRAAGFRLDVIFPADDPHTALLTQGRERVRLSKPGASALPDCLPPFEPQSLLTRSGGSPAVGRAGMLYRDLIPGRLGGRYIASHIAIPDGGPVEDWVHYHRVALQMIVVRRGWVRVLYQDQGESFVLNEGDLVLQPPGIRHRVLESSPGLEVVEISAPALHETFADHDMVLPNVRAERLFGRQRFLRHIAAETDWTPFLGAEAQETGMAEAAAGLAEVRIVRPGDGPDLSVPGHDGELVFGFVLDGTASLDDAEIGPADAFVISPGKPWSLSAMTSDFRLLHVTTGRLDAAA